MTWPEAIVQVLTDEEGRALHVRKIAQLAGELEPRLRHTKPPHQTVSAICQRDPLRFKRGKAANTFRLVDRWLNPDGLIQSMITVRAGAAISSMLRALLIPKGRRVHCQAPGCRETNETSKLHVHHKKEKADLFRKIVRRHRLALRPSDTIANILKGYDLLMEHPAFRDKKHLLVLCEKHHKERKKAGKGREAEE